MKIEKIIAKKPYLIAGPCSGESEFQMLKIAHEIKETSDVFRAGVWKPRTSPGSFEGVGEIALKWLQKVQSETGLKVITEVATANHVNLCLEAGIDMLWIGARTTVNPFYIQEISEALKGVDIPVFVKNPIHPEMGLWLGALERLNKAGVNKLAAIHRGFYNYKESAFRNDPKWEMPIKLRKEVRNLPIICDPSHIAGKASLIEDVSQTAMDINLDGLMIETHNNPSKALSDAQQQISPKELKNILNNLIFRDAKLRDEAFKDELLEFRNQIDLLDHQIIELLNDRKKIVEIIANFKNKNKLTIFQIERWFEILKSRKSSAHTLKLDSQMVAEIFELIHKYSILTQTKIMR
ncbi:MAG: 3-deoxy-7-phosphoheptulonate synthase [Flavobacteriales bacterium]|nr:3-deoxy-7-phosphoheptulonate synthase [Flavobacteriales bacterium]